MTDVEQAASGRRLLPRGERRAQLIRAGAAAFARQGFAATSLEDVAREAGVTRAIIYRHFTSKTDLYQAALDDARQRLHDRVGSPGEYSVRTVQVLVDAACDDPDGFRLLFLHARREPEFASFAEERERAAARIAESYLREALPDPAHRHWVAGLIPRLTIDLVLSWLDAGQPASRDELIRTIRAATRALTGRTQAS